MKTNNNSYRGIVMAACCFVTASALLLLTYTDFTAGKGAYALLFLCPAMHLFLHRNKSHKQDRRKPQVRRLHLPDAQKLLHEPVFVTKTADQKDEEVRQNG